MVMCRIRAFERPKVPTTRHFPWLLSNEHAHSSCLHNACASLQRHITQRPSSGSCTRYFCARDAIPSRGTPSSSPSSSPAFIIAKLESGGRAPDQDYASDHRIRSLTRERSSARSGTVSRAKQLQSMPPLLVQHSHNPSRPQSNKGLSII